MEKLMWKYLDVAYPHVYKKMTKFGKCLVDGDRPGEVVLGLNMVKQLMALFDCSENDGHSVVRKWLESRPEYENIINSTNPHVLIAKFS
jgi:hypothetical protein